MMTNTDPRSQINEKLIKIKQEHDQADYSISSYDSDDMSHVYEDFSQGPRQQQFYQDLDHQLNDLTRDQYVNEIITLCRGDCDSINDYRIRLTERARGFPECPETRLVNRRNTPNSTKVERCANDCYILNMFNNGDRSKEINDVFSNVGNITMNDSVYKQQKTNSRRAEEIQETSNNNIFIQPEATATLIELRAEIKKLSDKQNTQSEIMSEIRNDMKEITANVRLMYGATKSILPKMPETSEQSRVDKLQNDVSKISSTLRIINKRLNDNEVKQSIQPNIPANETVTSFPKTGCRESIALRSSEINYAEALTRPSTSRITDADSTKTPSQEKNGSMQVLQSSTSLRKILSTEDRAKTLMDKVNNKAPKTQLNKGNVLINNKNDKPVYKSSLTASNKTPGNTTNIIQGAVSKPGDSGYSLTSSNSANTANDSTSTRDERPRHQEDHGGFTAVKRKKIVSYHISNIDIDVNIKDIYEYMRYNKVHCTNVRVYYGKEMASARVNVHESDSEIVEDTWFWPENIVCRKWQSKSDWESELERRNKERQQRNEQRQQRYRHRDHYNFGELDPQYRKSQDECDNDEQAERDSSNKWWNSWHNDNNRHTNVDDRDYQSHRR